MKPLKIGGIMAVVVASLLLGALISTSFVDLFQHGGAAENAGRRTQCINNLKQIGMAITAYSQVPTSGTWRYGVFPPGTVAGPEVAPEKRCGWASLIYLYGEEGCSGCPQVYTDLAWDDPKQVGAGGRDHEMRCPSCPRALPSQKFVPAVYIGIAGLGVDAPALSTTDKRAGIFGDDRTVAPSDVKDGLANTMMVVDSSANAGPWFAGTRNTVRGLDPANQPYIGKGRPFGGIHEGVAMVLMADGSVRIVKDSVAPKVFEAMSTIASGEKVTLP